MFSLSLRTELRYCINLKQTNFTVYLPWRSNYLCAHKLGWVKGERAHYLRTNSHEVYFGIFSGHLRSCVIRLHYPALAGGVADQRGPALRHERLQVHHPVPDGVPK